MNALKSVPLKLISKNLGLIEAEITTDNISIEEVSILLDLKNQIISSESDKVTRLMRSVGVAKLIEGIGDRLNNLNAALTVDRGLIAVVVKSGDKELKQYAYPVMVADKLSQLGILKSSRTYPIAKAYLENPDIITVLAAGLALDKIERTIAEFNA